MDYEMQPVKSSRFSPPDQVKIPSLAGLKMTKTPGIRAKTQRRKADSPDVSDTSVELDTKRKVQLPRKMKEIFSERTNSRRRGKS